MWKVLIVDDEAIVRTGIKMMPQWRECGFEIVGEANSGSQALQTYSRNTPHVVFTDIRMPGMNGIELLHMLKEENPDVYVVILTNYDDKDYIKKALRFGANDFLMKSEISGEALRSVLERVNQQLKEKDNQNVDAEYISMERKRRFLYKLVNKAYEDEQIPKKFVEYLELADQEIAHGFFTALVYAAYQPLSSNTLEPLDASIDYLVSLVSGIVSNYSESIVAYNESYKIMYIMLVSREGDMGQRELLKTCTDIKNAVKLYAGIQMHMGISRIYADVLELCNMPGQAEEAHIFASICHDSPIVFYDDLNLEAFEGSIRKDSDYFYQLSLCNREKLEEALIICNEAIEQIKEHRRTNLKRVFCSEFCAWFSRISLQDITDEQVGVGVDMQRMIDSYDCDALLCMVKESIFSLADISTNYRRSNNAVDTVLAYIHEHYVSPITLEDMAKQVHLNKNYLSSLFSEQVGVSSVTYLTKYRVKKAMELLIYTDMPVRDVATEVGFSSDRYFGQAFKNETGHPPTYYRKRRKENI